MRKASFWSSASPVFFLVPLIHIRCVIDFEVREFSQPTQIPLQNRNPPPSRHIDQIFAELTRCPVGAFLVRDHPCAEQFISHGIKRGSADLKLVQQPVPLIRLDRISRCLPLKNHLKKSLCSDRCALVLKQAPHQLIERITRGGYPRICVRSDDETGRGAGSVLYQCHAAV